MMICREFLTFDLAIRVHYSERVVCGTPPPWASGLVVPFAVMVLQTCPVRSVLAFKFALWESVSNLLLSPSICRCLIVAV